jgi:hypothetical protein
LLNSKGDKSDVKNLTSCVSFRMFVGEDFVQFPLKVSIS